MLERFNFFDVYAYFLPGITWLTLVSLPYCIFAGRWPSEQLMSALASAIAGYILGHVLYQASREAFPAQRAGKLESQTLLDANDDRLSEAVKAKIRTRAKELLGADLADTDGARQDVFLMARALLNVRKEAFYAEQFQGMYALSRGLAGACFLGGSSYLGWGAWDVMHCCPDSPPVALVLALLGLVAVLTLPRWFTFLLAGMVLTGAQLAQVAGGGAGWKMLVAGASTAALGWLFLAAQKRFQVEFAKAVYVGLSVTSPPLASKPGT